MKHLRILIVEDGKSQREMLRDFLAEEVHTVLTAETGEQGLDLIRQQHIDVALLDYKMPGMDGIDALIQIKQQNPEIDVIMMTAYGTIDTAVEAMKAGALDYITKPVELEELVIQLDRIAGQRNLVQENRRLRERLEEKHLTSDRIIFQSPAMQEVVNLAGRVADSNVSVLIEGESGTGKELIACLIHQLSQRSSRPLITVNCAALAETLLESELFGHEKGAFTGADRRRIGRFEEADGGSLFLDEIGELSQTIQVKLLRFLQEREFQRVGGNQTLKSDVRVISATNRRLKDRVREGRFREDLLYRLNVLTIDIPSLRDRKPDIPLLLEHFIQRFATQNRKPVEGIDAQARNLLMRYDYPGNVRELENIIERAVVITRNSIISARDLPFVDQPPTADSALEPPTDLTLKQAVESLEREMIRQALATAEHHQTRAAEQLGLSERMLRYKMKKYNLNICKQR